MHRSPKTTAGRAAHDMAKAMVFPRSFCLKRQKKWQKLRLMKGLWAGGRIEISEVRGNDHRAQCAKVKRRRESLKG